MYAKERPMFLNTCLYTLKSCTAWANCSTNIWFPSTSRFSRPIGVSICSNWRYLVQAKKIRGRTCVSYRHLNQKSKTTNAHVYHAKRIILMFYLNGKNGTLCIPLVHITCMCNCIVLFKYNAWGARH